MLAADSCFLRTKRLLGEFVETSSHKADRVKGQKGYQHCSWWWTMRNWWWWRWWWWYLKAMLDGWVGRGTHQNFCPKLCHWHLLLADPLTRATHVPWFLFVTSSFQRASVIFQEESCHEENEVDLSVSRATGSLLCDKGRGQRSNIWQLLVAAICRTFSNQNLSSCNLLILLTDDFDASIQQLCAVELMHYKHFAKEIL